MCKKHTHWRDARACERERQRKNVFCLCVLRIVTPHQHTTHSRERVKKYICMYLCGREICARLCVFLEKSNTPSSPTATPPPRERESERERDRPERRKKAPFLSPLLLLYNICPPRVVRVPRGGGKQTHLCMCVHPPCVLKTQYIYIHIYRFL